MFTFKTEKSTGRWRSFYPDTHIIKIKGAEVGRIDDNRPHKISLMVFNDDLLKDGGVNCDWKWITLKKESNSVAEAKEWLKGVYKPLSEMYRLCPLKG